MNKFIEIYLCTGVYSFFAYIVSNTLLLDHEFLQSAANKTYTFGCEVGLHRYFLVNVLAFNKH